MADIKRLLQLGRLQIVGSILKKDTPRDLDIVLFIPNKIFNKIYLNVEEWKNRLNSGDWNDGCYIWSNDSVRLTYLMEKRLQSKLLMDCKIEPMSYFNKKD